MIDLPVRKRIRLKNYDYSQAGCYFVTMCTKHREAILGTVSEGAVQLSKYGEIAENELLNIPSHYQNIQITQHIVMPNHVHAIVAIQPTERINPFPMNPDISNIIGKYKAGVTRIIGNTFMRSAIWQPRFHDHIIRNETEYLRIWQYIDENPARWHEDLYFVDPTTKTLLAQEVPHA